MNKKFFAYRIMGMNVVNPITLNTLRGVLYLPELTERMPLVITAHELASNYHRLWPAYGENLASLGIAVYSFDFAGGGPKAKVERAPGNRSDGNATEMSVMTELKDMEAVLDSAKTWSFVDGKKLHS